MNSNDFKVKLLPIHQKLFRISLRLLANQAESEDIVQEVYIKLWNMRDKLGEINNLEAFATTITKNLCLDKLKRRQLVRLDDQSKQVIHSASQDKDLHEIAECSDSYQIVKQLISKLPDQQKAIITMRDINEFTFEEIEEITGLSVNNIRVSLSRARKQVRDELIRIHEYGTELH